MKHDTAGNLQKRAIAAVCAAAVVFCSTANTFAFQSFADTQSTQETKASGQDSISAGGTITSGTLTDSLGLESTSIRLTVESVLVESGDDVTAGTALYQITADSLAKAEKTLRTELQAAESALLQQKMSYRVDQNQAYALYQSELLLGDTAKQDYETGLDSLADALDKAYDDYQEALDTVNNTPTEIKQKQTEVNSLETQSETLKADQTAKQEEADAARSAYTSAASSYNSLIAEYNAAAGVVRYLGKTLGKDISDVTLAQTITGAVSEQNTSTETKSEAPDTVETTEKTDFSEADFSGSDFPGGDFSGMPDSSMKPDTAQSEPVQETQGSKPEMQSAESFSTDSKPDSMQAEGFTADSMPAAAESGMPSQSTATGEMPSPNGSGMQAQSGNSVNDTLNHLYETAYESYESQKQKLSEAKQTYEDAQQTYQTLAEELNTLNTEVKENQSSITALNKEISTLNTTLTKAKSNLSKLRSEYNSLKNSYATDQIELKHTYETDTASYQNAEYHYKITLATIEDELNAAQEARDTAAENLRIFEADLADGCIRAKRDGMIYSLNCQEGRSANLNSPVVSYVNESAFAVTVEVDQNDVTQITIGDTAILYSSETGMANGKVTAIAAGTANSLADVRFNVTITADETAQLYSGESVNVYFNAGSLGMSDFTDFRGKSGSEDSGSRGKRPDFSGGMPEDFDPANMPDFGSRKDD